MIETKEAAEEGVMRFSWPNDTVFHHEILDVEQDSCSRCGQPLHVCAHRRHRIFTLKGPVELLCRLAHCSDPDCADRGQTLSPPAELTFTLPRWLIGWDVFCWMGQRRFARHWSVAQLQAELRDTYSIPLRPDAILAYLSRYQTMLAARQQDPQQLARAYAKVPSLVLSIDGLQPEKGHETLYTVREWTGKRIWFAESLLSSNQDEVRRLLSRAREWAKRLGKPVRLWLSDKQDAFVGGIALEFPKVPHRYCDNHFLRDLAKPMLEADSTAKVQMRRRVRGLRAIERRVLECRRESRAQGETRQEVRETSAAANGAVDSAAGHEQATKAKAGKTAGQARAAGPTKATTAKEPGDSEEAGQVVLDYCAVVRGILNDDQGGPLHPPGLRMAEALAEVRASLGRNLALNKPGRAHTLLARLAGCIDRGLAGVQEQQQPVQEQVKAIQEVAATLDAKTGTMARRQARYAQLQRRYEEQDGKFYEHLGKLMGSFADGLFVPVAASKGEDLPSDNLDMERWFRTPKGHERRVHGHKHAGVRIVVQGPTLLLALDAHKNHSKPFTAEDLLPYRDAQPPPDQREAMQRHKLMRQARSKKNGLSDSQS
jgi:hypothetical protein